MRLPCPRRSDQDGEALPLDEVAIEEPQDRRLGDPLGGYSLSVPCASWLWRVGGETMKEALVRRITWNSVAAVPRSIGFRRQPCSTSVSISTTSASRSASSARSGPRSHPEVRRVAWRRRGVEWERPYTLVWRYALSDDAEGMSGKSRHRLAPVWTEASSWTSDRGAQRDIQSG
jgi:hypothetical protein